MAVSDETILRVFFHMTETNNVTTTERRLGYRPGWLKMTVYRNPTVRFAVDAGRWMYERNRTFRILKEARNESREAVTQSS